MGDQAANISLQNTSCSTFLLFLQNGQPLEVYGYVMFVNFTIIYLFHSILHCLFAAYVSLRSSCIFHNLSSWLRKETLKNFLVQGNPSYLGNSHTTPARSFGSLCIDALFIHAYLQALYLFYIVT